MKNRHLITIIALAMIFGIAGSASAQRRPVEKMPVQAERTQVQDRVRADMPATVRASTSAERQEKRVENQQAIAKRHIQNAARVIGATIDRLEKIASRIESRIEKLEAAGGNVTNAKNYLALARTNLMEAEETLSAYASIDLSSDIAQDNFERVRSAVRETRELIREAHQNLSLSVRSLAGVQAQVGDTDEGDEDEN